MAEKNYIQQAAAVIRRAAYPIAFTGAGISVESGVPPFRGEEGIWNRYDPKTLELEFFLSQPKASWEVIREIFYGFFAHAKANSAHVALARLEEKNILKGIITQNIDNLHQQAGSREVYEFHGNAQKLVCLDCRAPFGPADADLEQLPPRCHCGGLLKPDFIFFGEGIPHEPYQKSVQAAGTADVVLVIGSTGEVMPAAQMPYLAKQGGATIVEINPGKSNFTNSITDIYLSGKAAETMEKLFEEITGEEF